jgi:hypothetical protein
MLASRPAAARFLSRELAIRFVSDDPPQSLIDRMSRTYLASDGDISAVLRTLFHSPELWAASDYRAKVKTPLEFVVSAARASNADITNDQPLENALRQMGMPLYGCVPPSGYKWDADDWVSTGSLVDRMNFALNLAANRMPGITVRWSPAMRPSAQLSAQPSAQLSGQDAELLDERTTDKPTPESEESRRHAIGRTAAVPGADCAGQIAERIVERIVHASACSHAAPESRSRGNRSRKAGSDTGRTAHWLARISTPLNTAA